LGAKPERETIMTPEERQLLDGLFERVRAAANGPRDADAERYIADAARSTPAAAYVLAQTVLVQQQALENASKHIQDLEAQAKAGGEQGSFLGNIGRSIFGGASPTPQQPAYAPPPQRPAYAPQAPAYAPAPQQGGPWGAAPAQGGGFMSGALQTATGVAGGVLLGNAIGGLFGGHSGGLFGGGFGGGSGVGGGEVINNYYETDPAGQHAEDVLQDQDQDQDDAQDAADFGGGGGDDTI
jgi:hypothetical protein